MRLAEIQEGVDQIWSRKGTKTVRKFRCTSGPRKGRIVAKISTCNAPKDIGAAYSMKKTKRAKGQSIKIKTRRTKKYNPASRRLKRLNRTPRRSRKKI
jgi:hypothetical protein